MLANDESLKAVMSIGIPLFYIRPGLSASDVTVAPNNWSARLQPTEMLVAKCSVQNTGIPLPFKPASHLARTHFTKLGFLKGAVLNPNPVHYP